MKIRTDFVTNSSSSSFVITYKNEVKNKEIVYDNLSDYDKENYYPDEIDSKLIQSIINNKKGSKITEAEDVLRLLKNEYVWEDLEDFQIMVDEKYSDIYKNYINLLKNHKILYFSYVDDGNDLYDQLSLLRDILSNDRELRNLIDIESFEH